MRDNLDVSKHEKNKNKNKQKLKMLSVMQVDYPS
jgi:hypothetical protein